MQTSSRLTPEGIGVGRPIYHECIVRSSKGEQDPGFAPYKASSNRLICLRSVSSGKKTKAEIPRFRSECGSNYVLCIERVIQLVMLSVLHIGHDMLFRHHTNDIGRRMELRLASWIRNETFYQVRSSSFPILVWPTTHREPPQGKR